MKKILALFVTVLLLLSVFVMSGCVVSGPNNDAIDPNAVDNEANQAAIKTKEAYEKSKEAFEKISAAYEEVDIFSHDIYEAWYLGIYEESTYKYNFYGFCSRLSIDTASMEKAVANLRGYGSFSTSAWSNLYTLYNNSFFSACIDVVSEAYSCGGKVDEITKNLDDAKALMKELSANYSDYEHYPTLKKYYTNVSAFLDYCKNPNSSFEQMKETVNDYRNVAKECQFDLKYVFEDFD